MEEIDIERTVQFVRSLYPNQDTIPLHAPHFSGNEVRNLAECIESTFVSYVGHFVTDFEQSVRSYTGSKHAVATVNGTTALHLALLSCGVTSADEIITQAISFAATAAAICHSGAIPVFLDIDETTLGLSPDALRHYLSKNAVNRNGKTTDRATGRTIAGVLPVHVFGHPARILEISEVCEEYSLPLIEDAAESLGSIHSGIHTGRFGRAAILSFNGNKIVTTGGGGMLLTDDERIADTARHLSTTAKVPHEWEFIHDQVGFNYRMPNVNAAVGLAQMEYLDRTIVNKRETAARYSEFFGELGVEFLSEPPNSRSNYWLNAIVLDSQEARDAFLIQTNGAGITTRPVWRPLPHLAPYSRFPAGDLRVAETYAGRVINLPSGVRV